MSHKIIDVCRGTNVETDLTSAVQSGATHMLLADGDEPDFYRIKTTRSNARVYWTALLDQVAAYNGSFVIGELVGKEMPVVIDVRLPFDASDDDVMERLQEDFDDSGDTISAFSTLVVNALERAIFDTQQVGETATFSSIVLSSGLLASPTGEAVIHMRFQIPRIRLQPHQMEHEVLHRFYSLLRSCNVFGTLRSMPIDTLEVCISTPSYVLPVLGLGSFLKDDPLPQPPLHLIGWFPSKGVPGENAAMSTDFDSMVEAFPIDLHISYSDIGEIGRPYAECLPLILSLGYDASSPLLAPRSEASMGEDIIRSVSRSAARSASQATSRSVSTVSRSASRSTSRTPSRAGSDKRPVSRSGQKMSAAATRLAYEARIAEEKNASKAKRTRTPAAKKPKDNSTLTRSMLDNHQRELSRLTPIRSSGTTRSVSESASERPSSRASTYASTFEESGAEEGEGEEGAPTEGTVYTSYLSQSKTAQQISIENPDTIRLPCDQDLMRFMDLINPERAKNSGDLQDIASALYTVTNGFRAGRDRLHRFIQAGCGNQSQSIEATQVLWEEQRRKPIPKTGRTLGFLARADNKTLYEKWHRGWFRDAVEEIITVGHVPVANAFFREYWLELLFSPQSNQWYMFEHHIWRKTTPSMLGEKITAFSLKLKDILARAQNAVHEAEEGERMEEKSLIARLTKVIDRLDIVPFRKGTLTVASERFAFEAFTEYIDTNFSCKGVQNGVLVCLEDQAIVRAGRPEDYVTRRMAVEYNSSYTMDSPEVKFVLEFYRKVYCDEELEMFMRQDFASYLRSGNHEKLFRNWIGAVGNNAKTVMQNAHVCIFGEYATTVTTNMYTGRDSGAESSMPQLTSMMKCAIVFISESKEDEQLRADVVKKHTGNEIVPFRSHHQEMQRALMACKLLMQSNNPSQWGAGGTAMIKRLCITPHNSIFCDDAPESIEEQYATRRFPNDTNFAEKLAKAHDAMFWLMVHDYASYRRDWAVRPPFPAAIREANAQFWARENMYGMFFSGHITKLPEDAPKARLSYDVLYSAFSSWFGTAYGRDAVKPSKKTALMYFVREMGQPVDGSGIRVTWEGYRIDGLDVPM